MEFLYIINLLAAICASVYYILIALMAAAIVSLFSKRYKKFGTCYLWWLLFPFVFPWQAKKKGVITNKWKSWLLVSISPCAFSIYFSLLFCTIVFIGLNSSENGYIYPERPLDRTKDTHYSIVNLEEEDEFNNNLHECYGDYIKVIVPFKGDTITVEDGWTM